jgi:hypothetical protein
MELAACALYSLDKGEAYSQRDTQGFSFIDAISVRKFQGAWRQDTVNDIRSPVMG